jgi:hypothetical protein
VPSANLLLISDYNENPIGIGVGIVELRQRSKRGEHDMLDFGKPQGEFALPPIPTDYEVEDENKEDSKAKDGKAPETVGLQIGLINLN